MCISQLCHILRGGNYHYSFKAKTRAAHLWQNKTTYHTRGGHSSSSITISLGPLHQPLACPSWWHHQPASWPPTHHIKLKPDPSHLFPLRPLSVLPTSTTQCQLQTSQSQETLIWSRHLACPSPLQIGRGWQLILEANPLWPCVIPTIRMSACHHITLIQYMSLLLYLWLGRDLTKPFILWYACSGYAFKTSTFKNHTVQYIMHLQNISYISTIIPSHFANTGPVILPLLVEVGRNFEIFLN